MDTLLGRLSFSCKTEIFLVRALGMSACIDNPIILKEDFRTTTISQEDLHRTLDTHMMVTAQTHEFSR